MNRSTIGAVVASLSLAFTAFPAFPAFAAGVCSIHAHKGASDTELASLAKLSRAAAESIALKHIKGHGTVSEGELEAERGCLIWSFDVKVEGRDGVQEVNVDAGNGKVLNVHHETVKQEAAGK